MAQGRHASKRPRFDTSPSVHVASGALIASAAGFATNILVPHLLSLSDAAAFYIATSAAALIPLITRFGLDRAVIRVVAEARRGGVNALGATVRRIQLVTVAIFAVTAGVLSAGAWVYVSKEFFHSSTLADAAIPISAWVGLESARVIPSETLRALGRIGEATWLGTAGRSLGFLSLLLAIGTLPPEKRFVAAAVAALLSSGAAMLVSLIRLKESASVRPAENAARYRTLFRASWPFYASTIAAFASNQGDVLIGGVNLSQANTAQYAAASKISLLLILPAVTLVQSLAPDIAKMWLSGEREALERRIRSLTTMYAAPTAVLGLCLIVGSGWVTSLLYPATYVETAHILSILAIGPLFIALSGPSSDVLLLAGFGRTVAIVTVAIASIQILAMIFCAQRFGPDGLAVASSGGSVILALAMVVIARKCLGIITWPYLKTPNLAKRGANLRRADQQDQDTPLG